MHITSVAGKQQDWEKQNTLDATWNTWLFSRIQILKYIRAAATN